MKACYAIVAHVDSGKTSICEFILKKVYKTNKNFLDHLSVEKKRGITVKLKQFTFDYDNDTFFFIDTPGHSQFFNEVERALLIVDNILLVIDLLQGIQSQTKILINILLKQGQKVILVFNKLDLCRDFSVINQTLDYCKNIGLEFCHVCVSAKTGEGMEQLMQLFKDMRCMSKKQNINCDGEIFDVNVSNFGFKCFVRTYSKFKKGDEIILPTGETTKILKIIKRYNIEYEINEIDACEIVILMIKPKNQQVGIGYIFHNIHNTIKKDIVINKSNLYFQAFPEQNFIKDFDNAIRILIANDPSIETTQTNNSILGCGYNIGVKGKIHMEIVISRLSEICNFEVIYTNLFVSYLDQNNKLLSNFKDFNPNNSYKELFVLINIQAEKKYISQIIELVESLRGEIHNILLNKEQINNNDETIQVWLPLSQLNNLFYDNIQKLTSGYVLFNVLEQKWFDTQVNLMTILVNKQPVEDFGILCHPMDAKMIGNKIADSLSNSLKLRNFNLRIQVKYGKHIIVSTNIKSRKINVVAKCYGGDIRRKMKLWEKQTKGRQKQQINYKHKFGVKDLRDIFKSLN